MKFYDHTLVVLIAMFVLSTLSFASAGCLSPSPDNYRSVRNAEFKGKISKIVSKDLILVSNDKFKNVKIKLGFPQTEIFSQFGEPVGVTEMKVNDEVEIWSKKCQRFDGHDLKAQAIMIVK